MGILTSKLPELPRDSDKYFITYKTFNGEEYYILTLVDNYSGKVEEDFTVSSGLADNFVLYDGQWCSTWLNQYSEYRDNTATDVIYSSYDMYTVSDEIYYNSSKYDYDEISVAGNTVTASSINTTLRSEYLPVALILVVAVVGIVAFKKAWNWLSSCIRGA